MIKRDQIVAVGDIVQAVGVIVGKNSKIRRGKPGIVVEVCQSGGMARVMYATHSGVRDGWVRTDCVEIVSEAG